MHTPDKIAPVSRESLPLVLCVDDEQRVLDGLAAHLRRNYTILTANSAQAALQLMKEQGPPSVIVSDMRMPGMDGAALLKRVKQLYPETTRVLLTGDPGRDTATSAVNEGQIFRFLTKPCLPEQLRGAIEAALGHHRLMVAERILLQETLIGCIKALVDVLAMTNPVAFGRATRVKRLCMELSVALGQKTFWQLEAAAMLSQIGFVSLPVELVEKLYYGQRLTPEERVLAEGAPQVAQNLLSRIPRLEMVIEILEASHRPNTDQPEGAARLGAGILRLVLEYDAQIAQGQSPESAIQHLRAGRDADQTKLLNALEALVCEGEADSVVSELSVGRVRPGMVFMDDLHTPVGTLLVPKGFEVTEAFLERMQNFGPSILEGKVRMRVAAKSSVVHT